MRSIFVLLITLLGVQFAFAQYYGAIKVDQPGLSNSYQTVRKFRLQIESEMAYRQDSKFSDNPNLERKEFQFATTLIRFGLTKTLEVRLGSGFLYQRDKNLNIKSSVSTIQGVSLGGKWHFLEHKKGIVPNASFLLQADLPVGSEKVVSKYIEPEAALLVSHPLSDAARLDYNAQISYRDQNFLEYFYALSLNVNFSPQTSSFIEFASKHREGSSAEMYFDGGLNLLIKRNSIAYIFGGKGLNKQAADWFVTFGMGIRLPR